MGLKDNKSPWASRNKADGPLKTPDLYAQVDREFSTQFIAERLGNKCETIKDETMRALRDKIGKQIDTALKTGKLVATDGKFLFGDLTGWVKTKPRLAHSVDGLPSIGHASVSITAPSMQVSAFVYSLPVSLDNWQAALADAYRELNGVREENHRLRATVATLAPLKAKATARSENARRFGKQGGRGNKK